MNISQSLTLKNFGNASSTYNKEAIIQTFYANKLADYCTAHSIPEGLWVDLGSGTGLLADALEKSNKNQSVLRVDGSRNMLAQNNFGSQVKLWDLNTGLPKWDEPPTLIASSFTLHWLQNPKRKLIEWFSILAPGGWLAIVVPVKGSFPEWHKAAFEANVECTALSFPSHHYLKEALGRDNIQYQELEKFTQQASRPTSLIKPFVKMGAQTTTKPSLTISDWRKIQKHWPKCPKNKTVELTWTIQLLLAKK